jgi:hypothetical protein
VTETLEGDRKLELNSTGVPEPFKVSIPRQFKTTMNTKKNCIDISRLSILIKIGSFSCVQLWMQSQQFKLLVVVT